MVFYYQTFLNYLCRDEKAVGSPLAVAAGGGGLVYRVCPAAIFRCLVGNYRK
jgi:hypothetical protein